MIRIFCDFFPILGEKIGVFLKNQCYDQNKYHCYDHIFSKFSFVSSQKGQFFRVNFLAKYLKNHNIGPRLGVLNQLKPTDQY
jgi:hypothetical protein